MSNIDELVAHCVETLQSTDEYREYFAARQVVEAQPEKWERLNEFRRENFDLQMSSEDSDKLFEARSRFAEKYADVFSDAEAVRFTQAELGFCRLVQTLQAEILQGIDFC